MNATPTDDFAQDTVQVESRPGLLRVLGPGMAVAIVVGNVIGSGIFAKPGPIAQAGGQFGLIISAWIVGGVLCLLGALCFAELAVMLPRAGGLYVYIREAYGRLAAFLFGWVEFLFSRPASIGALSMIFVGSLSKATHWRFGSDDPTRVAESLGGILVAVGLIALMTWVNIIGVIWGGRMQFATTIIKAGFVALVAALPFMLMGEDTSVSLSNFSSPPVDSDLSLARRFAIILLAVMWAYNGWHGITPAAEEVRDPRRNIPIALFVGIGVLIVLYVSANVAYHAVLPLQDIAASGNHAAEAVVKALLGANGEKLMSIGVMMSTLGAINSNMLLGPRISFAMGRDDVFIRQLGRVHVNYRTPALAILVQAVMGVVLVVVSGMLVRHVDAFREKSIFEILTNYIVFSASIFYMLSVFAVIVLRRKHPEWERPYRTLGYPFVPIAYLLFYALFLFYVFIGEPYEASIGILLIALGLPVFFGWRAWAQRHPENGSSSTPAT